MPKVNRTKLFMILAIALLWSDDTWSDIYRGEWSDGSEFTLDIRREGFTGYYSDKEYQERRFTIQRHGAFVFGALRDGREEMGKTGPTIYVVFVPEDSKAYHVTADDGWFGKLNSDVLAGTYALVERNDGAALESEPAVVLRDTYCPVEMKNESNQYKEFNGVYAGTMNEFCASVFIRSDDATRMVYSVGDYEPWNIKAGKTKERAIEWYGVSGIFRKGYSILVARRNQGLDVLYLAKAYATARLIPTSELSR